MTENEDSTWGIQGPDTMEQFWLKQMRARMCSAEEAAVRQTQSALEKIDRRQQAAVRQLRVAAQTIDRTAVIQIPQSICQIHRSLLPPRAELPPVMLTADGRVDFSYIRGRLVTSSACSIHEVDRIPFSRVIELFEYWKTYPPLHESLTRAMKLADGANCNASRTAQQQAPYPGQTNTSSSRQRRRDCKYEAIDKTLREIAKAQLTNHRDMQPQSPGQQAIGHSPEVCLPKGRRHGFEPNMNKHRAIAEIVSKYVPDWRERQRGKWLPADRLKLICAELDAARHQSALYEIPESWKDGTPNALDRASVNGWTEALDHAKQNKFIRDQLAYSLKMVLKKD